MDMKDGLVEQMGGADKRRSGKRQKSDVRGGGEVWQNGPRGTRPLIGT